MKKKFLVVFVAGLLGLSTLAVVAPATAAGDVLIGPDGTRYRDVTLGLSMDTDKLFVDNYSKHLIVAQYEDPTYGNQSVRVAAGQTGVMCADSAFDNMVTVTLNADTPTPITTTGRYAGLGSYALTGAQAELTKARAALKKARAALKKARKHHKKARIKKARKKVRRARVRVADAVRDLGYWQREYAYCSGHRVQ